MESFLAPETLKMLGTYISLLGPIVGAFIVVWREIRSVHMQINSRMDELLELTRQSAHAQGVIEGEDRNKPEFNFDPDE